MAEPTLIEPLAAFLPPVRTWFEQTLGQPTPPQAQGWPAIQRGENTLILAPTGSGKTLSAFLWGIDQLFRTLQQTGGAPAGEALGTKGTSRRRAKRTTPAELQIIYISPLKALNNDVERNLRVPLAGIRQVAQTAGLELPEIDVAVRSGDTPSRDRQAMLRKPPHILITTPESLYILLTSPSGREMFRTVRTVIVDEIHTLAGSKRGVHLSLSLERLQQLAQQPLQRIGLSATIQPLDEVARYLGGNAWVVQDGVRTLTPRPVTLVNAGYRKPLDLLVETVVDDFRNLPGESIWPSVIARVTTLIHQHKTTLIFVNNRRLAERAADWLNEQLAAEAEVAEGEFGGSGMMTDGVVTGVGLFGAGRGLHANPIRAHHGSMSKETRLTLERALKAGTLPALVGTSSLELGIDIGSVDLVVQLQSPKAVAQGLQRVGRAGHLVGQTSRGRIFPTHSEDVMEAAAVAGGMLRGDVEPIHTPRNTLDILAQQIVAMVSVENWQVEALFDLIRGAYAFTDLTLRALHSVLEMLAGRYPSKAYRELRARLVWDKVNNQLAALPGSRLLALTNGGTISDRGAFNAYLADGKTKLGELDEEFVYETRIGDTLMLGSQVWRVIDMTDDKVVVTDAAGATPRMPFWRGDYPWRPYELGQRVGAFRRTVAERLHTIRATLELTSYRAIHEHDTLPAVQELLTWLHQEYALDLNSAWHVIDYVAGQLDHTGAISSDKTILVELFDDALGDPRMVIQSPFGGKVNGLWGLALAGALRERTGVEVEVQSNDEGILFRFPDADAEFPIDLVSTLGPEEAGQRIMRELPNSALFGAQFRQNAARALLLPGLGRGKRTPFWLQRLRAKDLMQVVRHFDDFPIIAETYRDCLEEVMDWPHLAQVLAEIQAGAIQVAEVESLTPSPVAQGLLWELISFYMYEWDTPKAERQLQSLSVNRDLLQDLLKDVNLAGLLRSEAVDEVRSRLQHTAPMAQARTAEELANLFLLLGDLSSTEIAERVVVDPSSWIGQLAGAQRIVRLSIPTAQGPQDRWVAGEYAGEYQLAFSDQTGVLPAHEVHNAREQILLRYLVQAGPSTVGAILDRYAFPADWLAAELNLLVERRELAHGHFTPSGTPAAGAAAGEAEYIDRHALDQMHRRTLTILRHEVRPVPFAAYVDFLTHWQHLHPATHLTGSGSLHQALQQLRAAPVVGRVWQRDVLPLRLANFAQSELAALCQSGETVWVGSGGVDPRRSRIRFLFRGEGAAYLEPAPAEITNLSAEAQSVYAFLKQEGAVFQAELQAGVGMPDAQAEAALTELVMASLVTNDSLAALDHILQQGTPRAPASQPYSALEAELAEKLGNRTPQPHERMGSFKRPTRDEYRSAQQRVRQRLEQGASVSNPVAAQFGRWTLVHRFGVMGKALPPDEQAIIQARQLLARHGVVTSATLDDEDGAWNWGQIYRELQRLEMRGEVRRGLFVQGLPGIQFALPEVVEQLRTLAHPATVDDDALVVLNACDPANLYGSARDDAPLTVSGTAFAFARLPSTWLVLNRGLPVLLVEDHGARLTTFEVTAALAQRAIQTWRDHMATFESRLSVGQWNDAPVLNSPGQPLLEAAGFYREYPTMVWEKRRK